MTERNATYEVTLNGQTAIVYRHMHTTRRRWLGLLPDKPITVSSILGIFPCDMGLSLSHALNRPSELTLSLSGQTIRLKGRT